MKTYAWLLPLLTLSACASTRVVPTGPDTYMIQREGGTGFSGTNGLKMDALEGAGQYCTKMGKHLAVLASHESSGGAFGRYPSADVQFKCLNEGDPELKRGALVPTNPDQKVIIESR